MAERFFQHVFPNGLTLLAERMPAVQSAAMSFLVPAGTSNDPADAGGSANVLSDLILRGAGKLDSRELTDHLDRLGLQRSSSSGLYHTRLGCAALSSRVMAGLPTYADIVRRAHLPEDGFEAARDLSLQAIAGIDDDPKQKMLIALRERHFPFPFGRNSLGVESELKALTVDRIRQDYAKRFHARGAILSFAGDVDFITLKSEVERLFGDWDGSPIITLPGKPAVRGVHHQDQQSEQTHIGIAWPSILETDPDYYTVRLAVEVLSGGMSGRLFTEVREKRGLVYSVWAGYSSLKEVGSILAYAGTSNDRAQKTLDTMLAEFQRLTEGVTPAELQRAKTGLKAATIMQGESSGARAGAIAHDWFIRGRIRTLDEIKDAIDSVTVEKVNAYLKANPPGPYTIVTVGPKPLEVGR
ncbi:M16 family metallopeptidase [Humisphaera borealis]|uniref:Insulinase family protein n=1 Tax=Humisphaera borealis TaxID=2807512 RepID=A0A7M2WZE9_9BACT|nr:pitrilysin family protein [Humisphaera borealis]QOV90845.1 insulinase family protein [Humisphaera borealis]